MFRGRVKGTGYPIHPLVSPSLPLPCVTACHHISTGPYFFHLQGQKEIFQMKTQRSAEMSVINNPATRRNNQ